jgi:UDP-GlcNAc:undecaprenyl-phosphate GlcNAc-1-phosphate transferase
LLYFWSALIAFGGVALSIMRGPWLVVSVAGGLAAVGMLMSLVPRMRARIGRHRTPPPRPSPTRDPAGVGRP